MSTSYWLGFVIFWAVWLLVPMLVDGLSSIANLVGVWGVRRRQAARVKQLTTFFPRITVVVPVYNSERTLGPCLESLAAQDYPREQMEILVISNGTTDRSFDVFAEHQARFGGYLVWQAITSKGKAWALNAGIHLATGVYIFNIDSDVVLAPDALRQVVERMEAEPDLGAVTGSVEVLPPPPGSTVLQVALAECEFQEYLTAFQIGRQYQTLTGNLFTLAGAFSVFRRDVLLRTFLYSQATVTEDTDLTFEIHKRFTQHRVGAVAQAVAYVHPIESLSALYAQRVRWQRGQLEVSALHDDLLARPWWQPHGFTPSRVLLIDHTLAFPRLAWTFLLPILTLFGYPGSLLVGAAIALYAFYMMIDLLWLLTSWLLAAPAARQRLKHSWWIFTVMPLYRIVVFWFRLSGFCMRSPNREPGVFKTPSPKHAQPSTI
jgi:putative glycosyltransferase (exosortase G-associated)